ncbi:zinc finger, C4 type [Opisthorchis viverrini]|uniref:Zinc finger, C4 type n=1 Tax=Opisthorchis viverrini TaxID=6198 RepID=A0A1S8X2F3_OPIVI|nr:zinc finger, C4 type [Opisthorchis viverrini]
MRHTAARYRHAEAGGGNLSDSACPMGGQCRVEGPGRGKCPHCRYRKCLDLGMTLTPPGGESGCDISQIPCRVCGGPSSGFHFGSRIGRQPNAIKYYCAREISQLTSSSGESDANQPSSSVPSMSNGRSLQTSRQRADSASSDGEKLGRSSSHPRPPSWITDRSIQPAHSSTDQASSALLSIHLPQSQNGQLPSLNSPIKSFTPTKRADGNFASGGGPRRFSADSIQPPDSSPKSVPGQKRRKVSADRYPTGNNAAGVVYVDGSSMTFSPQCDPDSERVRYASSSSPSMAFRDSHACQLHELSSSRVSREWYGFFRRTVLSNVRLECLSNNDCPITPANRNMCKSCRFQRCLAVGMSKSGSRIGRQPNAIKYYCAREISQLTSSSGESDANQPSSSVPSMSNGRSLQTSRQRADSASSDGEKLGRSSSHPRPPSWITDRSIQPAHSSTDQASSALLSIHLPQSQNGQLPSLNSPIKSFTPTKRADGNFASGGGPRRFSADSIQPPDSSPKSVPGQKRRKVSADRYPTGNNAAGVVYVDGSSMTFSPQCDPDSERVRYASSSSPSMAFRDSHACQLHELSSSRVSREWVSSNESLHERARRPYDLPIDQLSHGSTTPLEYSLPNPDTSTHISSTTSIHEHDDLLVPSPGKLLVPLAVHLPLDESGTEELQMQYKVISANDVLQQQQPQRSDSASSTFTNNTYGTLLRDPGASTAALHFQSQQSSYRAQVVVPDSSPRRVSPLPSSNLSTSTPPSSNLPIRLNADEVQQLTQRAGAVSRSSRSVVDNLTSTVLQYRQHQHQQRLLADSGIKMDSGMTTIHIPCSSPSELHQSRTQSYGRLSSGSLPQPSKHSPVPSHPDVPYPSCSSSSPPTRIPIPSNHPSYPLSTSSGKPTSPELSWHPTKHQQQRTGRGVHNNGSANAAAAATELQFRAGCLPSKFELSPVSTYLNGNSNEPSLCPVDVTATSSASWFAAAAAAAAVANALMAASQAPSSSEISASDSYTAISSKLSHSRLKTESPLSSSGSPAVLVAAAAAAATAAEFVLSNRRVRGALPSEDFHHRSSSSAGGIGGATGFPVYSSPGTSSPSPPLGAFSRAASIIAATTAEALCAERASQLCMDYNLAGFGSSIRSAAATSSNSMEPTPSVNLQVTSKETHTTGIRSRNGLRAVSFLMTETYKFPVTPVANVLIPRMKIN